MFMQYPERLWPPPSQLYAHRSRTVQVLAALGAMPAQIYSALLEKQHGAGRGGEEAARDGAQMEF